MPEKIPPHKHCKECGKPIPMGDTFCSDSCETVFKSRLRRRKRQLYSYYLVTVLILIIVLIYLGFR